MVNADCLPKPKKSLGQHFLINQGICERIVKLLEPKESDQVLEIGPGPGALTKFLLKNPHKRLLLIEKDGYWADEREKTTNAEVLQMDALQFNWDSLCEAGEWKITGNLPYNIASPLIWDILSKCHCYSRAVFMVQKEVGERICAKPGSRQYGELSVWAQCHAKAKLNFSIGPGAFRPPPKVDSAVVSFEPLLQQPEYPKALKFVLDTCFQQRRKQLGGIFRRAKLDILTDALPGLDIEPQQRPENLSCQDFLELARIWAQANVNKDSV